MNAETPILAKEFLTAAELADMQLPGMPATERAIQLMAQRGDWQAPENEGFNWRRRQGRGGGIEYHYRLLPDLAQMALVLRHAQPAQQSARTKAKAALATTEMWTWFERQPDTRKAKARTRLEMLDAAMALTRGGAAWNRALATVAASIARAVAATLRDSPLKRDDIATRMSGYLGERVSKHMLDAYASEARQEHAIPVTRLIALMHATGDRRLLQMRAEPMGWAVIERRHLPLSEVAAIREREDELRRHREFLTRQARSGGGL